MVNSEAILKVIRSRKSTRTPFDFERKVKKKDLTAIIEAAKWSPTAHNMQNFEIVVIDDPALLEKLGDIKSKISEDFLRENYNQLSFSKKELLRKKVGILGANFPASWRDPNRLHEVALHSPPEPLNQTIRGAPVVLLVLFDPRKRAPASPGDFLGIMSLGCVMENMWLVAESLHVCFQVMSVFGSDQVGNQLRRILNIPKELKIAYAIRLGYGISSSSEYPRVRRDIDMLTHYNRY
ncbi:MAG TPA: nitroreductase family protein [Nitrososphaerales archaeon]|nr:nitroreductase family protein [Nitrososphaerales archaeon]